MKGTTHFQLSSFYQTTTAEKNNLLALSLTETQKQDARHLNLNLILGPGQDWELLDSWLLIGGTKIKVHIDLQK